jgi:hypothetical protein
MSASQPMKWGYWLVWAGLGSASPNSAIQDLAILGSAKSDQDGAAYPFWPADAMIGQRSQYSRRNYGGLAPPGPNEPGQGDARVAVALGNCSGVLNEPGKSGIPGDPVCLAPSGLMLACLPYAGRNCSLPTGLIGLSPVPSTSDFLLWQ